MDKLLDESEITINVIQKLVGQITPIGDSYEDSIRLKNLNHLGLVVVALVDKIRDVSDCKGSSEYSVRAAGISADEFINSITCDYREG